MKFTIFLLVLTIIGVEKCFCAISAGGLWDETEEEFAADFERLIDDEEKKYDEDGVGWTNFFVKFCTV